MPTKEFEITKKINKKIICTCKLNSKEYALIREGLFYAKTRDAITKRRDAYNKLLKKLPKTN